MQLSSGISAGASVNVDGSGVLAIVGTHASIGANFAGGFTHRVIVDGQTIFDNGRVYQSNFTGSAGFEFQDLMNSVVNSSSGQAILEISHPDGVTIRQTFQRTAKSGDGYVVNMHEQVLDSEGNLLSNDAASEYLEEPHRVKKVHFVKEDGSCFAAGTPVEMADGTSQPIEDIQIGDKVLAFDPDADKGRGAKVAKRVTQLHRTENQPLINFHGVKVTPGHAFLTGDGDFKPVIEILEEDGTVVMSDGKVVRARTGWTVGSKEDRAIPVGHPDGTAVKIVMMRAGALYGGKEGNVYTIEQMMESRGYHLMSDGRFVNVDGDIKTAYWEWGVPDTKMIAGNRASYDDLIEGSTIATGLSLMPSRPN